MSLNVCRITYFAIFSRAVWYAMGSEQSQQAAGASSQGNSVNTTPRFNQRPVSTGALQRGYTIASDSLNNSQLVDTSPPPLDSRPVSPPMSVCSDSDLPYISYTDKPIGGEFNSIKRATHVDSAPY